MIRRALIYIIKQIINNKSDFIKTDTYNVSQMMNLVTPKSNSI